MRKILLAILTLVILLGLSGYVLNYEVDFDLLTDSITRDLDNNGKAEFYLSEFVKPYTAHKLVSNPQFENKYTLPGVYDYEIYLPGIISKKNKKQIKVIVKDPNKDKVEIAKKEVDIKKQETKPKIETIEGLTYVNGIPIVNKKYSAPETMEGEDPEALEQLKLLISDMQSQGLQVSNDYGGYRSFAYQKQLYDNYVARDGQEVADTYSARPGYSEHHTGLAFDLKDNAGNLLELPTESQWLLDNAHKYGFIVRYQEGMEEITGYMAESWHLRYVGKEHAEKIHKQGITLEEYLGVEGGDYVE